VDITAGIDNFGRLICTVYSDQPPAVITSADAHLSSAQLLDAIADAEQQGYGECVWPEAAGEYRWMFRRAGDRLTVVALWSSGTLTGWQHVLHTETDAQSFTARVREVFATTASA
jgi:hypothetical protein